MQVVFLGRFSRDLDSIKDPGLKESLKQAILELESAPSLTSLTGIKKLKGHRHAFRMRVGSYRIGFYYENSVIELARFLDRRDIYKVFP